MAVTLSLEPGEVQLWCAELDRPSDAVAALRGALSDDEEARARRFHNDADRNRFVVSHATLRALLAGYLGADRADVRILDDEKGKPHLASPAWGWLRFNISHSTDVALLGFARDRAIGVDVERIREDFPFAEVGQRFFSADERAAVESQPDAMRLEAFFAAWTRKEAFLKGLGVGIARQSGAAAALDAWTVVNVDAGPRYAAAVAVEGGGVRVPAIALAPALDS